MTAQVVKNRSENHQQNMGAETPSNAITLSFNGVDFRLVPTGNSSNTNSSVSLSTNNGTYTTINLESFTGSLVVHSSSPIALNNVAATPVDSADISARTIEDEPATPESYSNKEETLLEQGQKKLPFERVNSKKRVSALHLVPNLCNGFVSLC
jgi:hypothetical protein